MNEKPSFGIAPAIPILRIFDEEKAREFYCGFLGFSVDWEYRETEELPLYMQISRDRMQLHLSEHHGDSVPGIRLFIPTEKIERLADDLKAKNYKYANPGIATMPWGRELEVTDPFGNRLTFCRQESDSGS